MHEVGDRRAAIAHALGAGRAPATPSLVAGKGHETRPGGRRTVPPVRRPRGRARALARGRRGRRRPRDPASPSARSPTASTAGSSTRPPRIVVVTGRGVRRLARRRARVGCSSRSPASRSTATPTRPPRSRAGPPACSPRRAGRARRGRRRRRARRRSAGSRPHVAADAPGTDGRGHHRLAGQDEHQGPARRVLGGRRRPIAPVESHEQRARRPADRAARRDRRPATSWSRDGRARARPHRVPGRHRAAPRRAWC